MNSLSVAELKAQVETDLTATALQLIIDAAERDIESYVGPSTAYTVEYDSELLTVLRLPVSASAIVSATEYTGAVSDPTKTELEIDDYELSDDGWSLRRLSDGTNPRGMWSWHVCVVITPDADVDRRKQVAIQLARLEITHTGYSQERTGDWSAASVDQGKERSRILNRLDGALMT